MSYKRVKLRNILDKCKKPSDYSEGFLPQSSGMTRRSSRLATRRNKPPRATPKRGCIPSAGRNESNARHANPPYMPLESSCCLPSIANSALTQRATKIIMGAVKSTRESVIIHTFLLFKY